MVQLRKKQIGNQQYYYLEHTIKENSKVKKKEKYIGKTCPQNIDALKKEFLSEIYKEKWLISLDKIKDNFQKEEQSMPTSLKEKQKHTFAIRFTYDTQRIEGSKLTLRETSNLLESGITPGFKPLSDIKEAESHKNLYYMMLEHKKDMSYETILYWHKKLLENTKPDIAGKVRQHQVAISGSKFLPPFPAEIYPLLKEFFSWYSKNRDKIHPVELAALVHLKFVTIHPFADGNGRISRIIMNFILNRHHYPLFNIPYEKRAGYYNSLERSQNKKEEGIFLHWFFRRYIKEHKNYLNEK